MYQDQFMDLKLYDHTYDLFCEQLLSPKACVLEIGCGPGNITKYISSKRPDLKILATDVSPQMVALAKKNLPNVLFQVIDARDIDQIDSKFTGILCGFCIPYLAIEDLQRLFKNCYHILESNGIIYLSFIEGDYTNSKFEFGSVKDLKAFVHYYSVSDISNLLALNHFKITNTSRIPYTKNDGSVDTHVVILAEKTK